MKRQIQMRLLLAAATIAMTTMLSAQSPAAFKPKSTDPTTGKAPAKVESAKLSDAGQRKFEANCGRCHTAPEQLSPSITGTVVRHMRVRASLSAQDEKDILRFLAP
jgi:cytochrome c5